MVRRDFPGKDPIGRHIQIDIFNQALPPRFLKSPQFANSFEIVGVVGTARNRGLDEPPMPAVFIPYSVLLVPNAFVIARTKDEPEKLIPAAREAVRRVDRNQPITETRTLEDWLATATAYPRFATFLFGVFGAVGLSLAIAGVFSVVSYGVAHRTREFGIRMALGAKPGDVLRLVMLNTAGVIVGGIAVGLAISLGANRFLASNMAGMSAGNPMLFAIVGGILFAAAMSACFVPAYFATAIQPMEALRHE
jgi:ABC-type antimicrobial peptide transport system permease subunit